MSLTVFYGPMFSGKTSRLIEEIRAAGEVGINFQVFKPIIDDRYGVAITSHDGDSVPCIPVYDTAEIEKALLPIQGQLDVIFIDEAQFFDEKLPEFIKILGNSGVDVYAAGLDMDFQGEPFGPMPSLLGGARNTEHLRGECSVCGGPSTHTYRKSEVASQDQILVGGSEAYESRCEACWLLGESAEDSNAQER